MNMILHDGSYEFFFFFGPFSFVFGVIFNEILEMVDEEFFGFIGEDELKKREILLILDNINDTNY